MKKLMILLALAIFLSASTAMATDWDNYDGKVVSEAKLTCGSTDDLEIGLSPKVAALYRTQGAANPQWYAISTVHIGGTEVYGTAQDVTKIYKRTDFHPGDDIPLATNLGTEPASEDSWGAGWSY